MIIFTTDETPFRCENEIIMYGSIDVIPTVKETTYILHTNKFSSDDVIYWSDIIKSRLVIVTEKIPKLSKKAKELCIIDDKLKAQNTPDVFLLVKALMNWQNRDKVKQMYQDQPTPLLLWFLKGNVSDIKLWRRVSKVLYQLPEKYLQAVLLYGIKPSRQRAVWPKKTKKEKERPSLFRESDKHWELILENSKAVANKVRDDGDVPSGMKKTKEKVIDWI